MYFSFLFLDKHIVLMALLYNVKTREKKVVFATYTMLVKINA